MNVVQAFTAMRKAADDFIIGEVDGDDLHSAVVDYTDALWPNWPVEPPDHAHPCVEPSS